MTSLERTYIIDPTPDYELLLIKAVKAMGFPELGGTSYNHVGDRDPINLTEVIASGKAFAAVRVLGGPSTSTRDTPMVDFDVFSLTQLVSSQVAKKIVAYLMGTPIMIRDGGTAMHIEDHRVVLDPAEVPWEPDRSIRRYYTSMQLAVRR